MTGTNQPNDRGTEVRLSVRNVGGISEAGVTLQRGVTLVSGANASNKSSLLRSLSGVLGGPTPPIKSDAERGSVHLDVGETDYYLELEREEGTTVVRDAERYAAARDLCELFVALTETNPIRQAVEAEAGLYELLMRPVDTAEIEAEIQRLRAEKADLDDRLEQLEAMESRLPSLRARYNSLQEALSDVEGSLGETRDALAAAEAEAEQVADGTLSAELEEKRSERTRIRKRIATNEEAIESLQEELAAVEQQLDDGEAGDPDVTVPELESELERLHYRKQQLTSTINALRPIVEMNEQLLEEERAVPDEMTAGEVLADLDPDSRSVTCWTCGSTVERVQIAEQVEAVQGIVREKRNEREAVDERIQTVTERKRELEQRRDEREQLRDRRGDLAEEIDERESSLESLRAEMRRLEREIEELQQQVDTRTGVGERLNDYYDEISDLEYERGQLTSELRRIESEIDEIESELAARPDVQQRREAVVTDLRTQRERIETIERDFVSTFNQEMQEVLDALGYESIERVWLERRSGPTGTEFELHVVRESDDGSAYDETVDTLSKSERSVIGLVVALAGYLVHGVGESIPFVVVDAVEMFDTDRIHGLMDHFEQHAEYVVATVLPEEGDQLEGVYETIATSAIAADS